MANRFFILSLLFSNFLWSQNNEQLLSQLSLREKIGQLCFVAAATDETIDRDLVEEWRKWQPLYRIERRHTQEMIKECAPGGIVFYGKNAHPTEQLALTQYYQSISKVPLLIALDAEVGVASRLNPKNCLRFPYNMTLGAIQDKELIYQTGYEVGVELKALGVHVNFAPVVDVNNNPANPVIGMRSFGENKERVALAGIAYMRGLQDAGIVACAKHFPGHGDTSVDSHLALPLIEHSIEHLKANELYPFKQLIDAGVKSIMTAHLEVPALEKESGLPASLSKSTVTDFLQRQMGFKGLIFTDALGMKGVADHFAPGELELKALQAGNDILLCPVDVVKAIDRIEKAVRQGEMSEAEIDRKVLKVLEAKRWAFAHSKKNENVSGLQTLLNAESAQQLLQQLFRKAMTCVKCEPDFPKNLSSEKILIITTDPSLKLFENLLRKVFHSQCNDESDEISHIIIGVVSKAECENMHFEEIINQIAKMKSENIKVTVVLFGSPYLLSKFKEAENVLTAYEVEEGAQIAAAEVLSGLIKCEGILPVKVN